MQGEEAGKEEKTTIMVLVYRMHATTVHRTGIPVLEYVFKTQRYDCCDVRTLMVARPSFDRNTPTQQHLLGDKIRVGCGLRCVCVC